jgi:hypothetical protein
MDHGQPAMLDVKPGRPVKPNRDVEERTGDEQRAEKPSDDGGDRQRA